LEVRGGSWRLLNTVVPQLCLEEQCQRSYCAVAFPMHLHASGLDPSLHYYFKPHPTRLRQGYGRQSSLQLFPTTSNYIQLHPTTSNYLQLPPTISNYIQLPPTISNYLQRSLPHHDLLPCSQLLIRDQCSIEEPHWLIVRRGG